VTGPKKLPTDAKIAKFLLLSSVCLGLEPVPDIETSFLIRIKFHNILVKFDLFVGSVSGSQWQ